jgi:hypothetical protein
VESTVLRNWRAWVLLALFVGPILIYMGFGAIWLAQRPAPLGIRGGWLYVATFGWFLSGILFAYLASRWTKSHRELLPPIDWNVPRTFSPFDRKAWDLVQEEADRGEAHSLQALTEFQVYVDSGQRLAQRLAAHYHPLSTDPIEHVPVVDILTALQLAAEDLAALCREVPGGDLLTPAHWKKAVQAAGYIQKANELYNYLLPIFQPVTGLVRLGTQKFMVQPAWRNMQQNVLRWFFRAYINRLGTHLIELYSGRLVIGADQYRKLTRKNLPVVGSEELPALNIAIVGARDTGKSALLEKIRDAIQNDLPHIRSRLVETGVAEELADRLSAAVWAETDGYTHHVGGETARDRSTRRSAVEESTGADLIVLVHSLEDDDVATDTKFLEELRAWYASRRTLEAPPSVAVLVPGRQIQPGVPGNHVNGQDSQGRDDGATARARVDALRAALRPLVEDVVVLDGRPGARAEIADQLLPAIVAIWHRAERVALIRHLYRASTHSKARRIIIQVGRQGRRLWESVKAARKEPSKRG